MGKGMKFIILGFALCLLTHKADAVPMEVSDHSGVDYFSAYEPANEQNNVVFTRSQNGRYSLAYSVDEEYVELNSMSLNFANPYAVQFVGKRLDGSRQTGYLEFESDEESVIVRFIFNTADEDVTDSHEFTVHVDDFQDYTFAGMRVQTTPGVDVSPLGDSFNSFVTDAEAEAADADLAKSCRCSGAIEPKCDDDTDCDTGEDCTRNNGNTGSCKIYFAVQDGGADQL